MFPCHYDFRLTEKNKNWFYWRTIIPTTNFSGTLLLPPPNITGNLHLGHALNLVSQDFFVRYSYLQKKPIAWLTGIDHAGISTQNKIESLPMVGLTGLDTDEQKRKYTLEVWYPQTRQIFYQQWERLGLLINYEKTRFTLDPAIQRQVRTAFVKLYQAGLIYRGVRLVNWDPQLKSVISDIETEHRPATSKLYYLKYPLVNSNDYLLVATSRPETIFADVALFVNPDDPRYQKYHNQLIKHPVIGKIIPLLTDKSIKIDFGSGVVKCTPGHDFSDYELGKKYQLPIISCCNEKGILNNYAGSWQGQKISNIREALVQELTKMGICQKTEIYQTNLIFSPKSGALVEPLLSPQWFLDLPALIKQIEQKQPNFLAKITFLPSRFRQILANWKTKSHVWCLSRQLWWGHRIPAWYHKKNGGNFCGWRTRQMFLCKSL